MKQTRQFPALAAGGIGIAAALLGAPTAAADELLPGCEPTGGGFVTGGQAGDCARPDTGGENLYGLLPGFGFGCGWGWGCSDLSPWPSPGFSVWP